MYEGPVHGGRAHGLSQASGRASGACRSRLPPPLHLPMSTPLRPTQYKENSRSLATFRSGVGGNSARLSLYVVEEDVHRVSLRAPHLTYYGMVNGQAHVDVRATAGRWPLGEASRWEVVPKHLPEPTRPKGNSLAVFWLKKKKATKQILD